MSDFDALERRLLDAVQRGVPLCERPFAALGEEAGESEARVIAALRGLRDRGVIRQIGAIFDSAALGFHGALLAFAVPPDRVEAAAEVVSAHPGVSHNYQRDHPVYRLWSTLTVPPDADVAAEAAALARAAGAERHLCLTAIRTFKIAVRFPMDAASPEPPQEKWHGHPAHVSACMSGVLPGRSTGEHDPNARGCGYTGRMPVPPLSLAARRIAAALECDLPIEERPFAALAARAGVPVSEFLAAARSLLATGRMRRYAAVLRHARVGFTWNVMTVWRVAPERSEEAGRLLAACDAVSHCYERTTAPDWPYTHYGMLHARTPAEGEAQIAGLAARVPAEEWACLRSVREFKKVRVIYFPQLPCVA
jgi:DNA-binding Lrp family transcriptional regulator